MEKPEDGFCFCVPDEILINILDYLSVDDIKSCRSVCRLWNSCCQNMCITDKEVIVFRSPAYSISEINEILRNIQRPRINVKFTNVDLRTLDLGEFGHKMKAIKVENCSVNDVELLKRMISFSPNLICLEFNLDTNFGLDLSILMNALDSLVQGDFENKNFREFECRGDGIRYSDNHLQVPVISLLCAIFPRVSRICTSGEIPLKEIVTKNLAGCMEVLRDCSVDFEKDSHFEFLVSSKLKTLSLEAKISFESRHSSSVDSCLRFISQLSELRELNLKIRNDFDVNDFGIDFPDYYDVEKGRILFRILLQVLRSCKKLRKLTCSYSTYTDFEIRLNRENAEELHQLLMSTDIEELDTFPIRIPAADVSFNCSSAGKIRELTFSITESLPQTIDFGRVMIQSCDLTTLYLTFRVGPSIDLAAILDSHKNLRTLHVSVVVSEEEKSKVVLSNIVGHEKLKYLRFDFWRSSSRTINSFVEGICRCKYPNLSTFGLDAEPENWWYSKQAPLRSSRLKNIIIPWLKSMPTLEEIYLDFYPMYIEDCIEICNSMNRLKFIDWSCTVNSYPAPEKIVQLFENAPYLPLMIVRPWQNRAVHLLMDSVIYYYSRSKKSLFECKRVDSASSSSFEGSPPYKLVWPRLCF